MTFPKKYFCFFVTTSIVLISQSSFSAEKTSLFVISQAGQLKKEGNALSAAHEYCRALLIDQTNRQAVDGLKGLVQAESRLSAEERLTLLQVVSLLDENQDLRKKIAYFTDKVDAMSQQHQAIDFETGENPSTKEVSSSSVSDEEMLGVFLDDLQTENDLLMTQYAKLRDGFEKIVEAAQRNQQMAISNARREEKRPSLSRAENFEKAYQDLALREADVDRLSQKLVTLSLELAEKEKQLAQSEQIVVASSDELKDMESRFRLGQKIIGEKEEEILKLKSDLDVANISLAKYQQYFAQNRAPVDANVKQLSGMLEIYRSKLKDFYLSNKSKDQSIKLLEERLLYVRGVIDQKHQQLELTFENLKKFEAKLQQMESQFAQQSPTDTPMSENELTALNHWLEKTQDFLAQQYDDFTYLEEYISGSY